MNHSCASSASAPTFQENTARPQSHPVGGSAGPAPFYGAASLSSTPFEILGPRKQLSAKMLALKAKVLAVIQDHPEGIDTWDISEAVGADVGITHLLCYELQKEAKVTGG